MTTAGKRGNRLTCLDIHSIFLLLSNSELFRLKVIKHFFNITCSHPKGLFFALAMPRAQYSCLKVGYHSSLLVQVQAGYSKALRVLPATSGGCRLLKGEQEETDAKCLLSISEALRSSKGTAPTTAVLCMAGRQGYSSPWVTRLSMPWLLTAMLFNIAALGHHGLAQKHQPSLSVAFPTACF